MFTSQPIKNLYTTLVARQAGHTAFMCDMESPGASWLISWSDVMDANAALNNSGLGGSDRDSAALLYKVVLRAYDAQKEYFRIKGYASGGSTNTPLKEPDSMADMAGLSIDYWLATLKAAENTSSTNTKAPYNRESGGTIPGGSMVDILGCETANILGNPSGVANSQLHYGTTQEVFIESQPISRGTVEWNSLAQSTLFWDLKLLNNSYELNDFGDTHSLVLIVDSLAVQAAFAKLCPTLAPKDMNTILQACSDKQADNVNLGPGNQGKCEGDVLENLVDALGKMLGQDKDPKWETMKPSLEGNTWWKEGERENLHFNLKLITDFIDNKSLSGKVTVALADANQNLKTTARTDFA